MLDSKGNRDYPKADLAGSGTKVKQFFAQIGLAFTAMGLLVGVLVIDVLLTSGMPGANRSLTTETFDMHLVTHDGRLISSDASGIPLALSPSTVYENKPGQVRGIYRTNAFGLRGPEIAIVPSKPRIIVVGGSTVWGLNVKEEETFSGSLQKQYPKYEVLNAGVIGFLSSQELGLAVSRLLHLEPDLIIALDGWNDVYDNYWWWILGDPGVSHRGSSVTFNFMENRLVNYHLVQTSPRFALAEATRTIVSHSTLLSAFSRWRGVGASSRKPNPEEPNWFDGMLANYVSNTLMLADVSRSRKCRLLVVVQPEAGQLMPPNQQKRFVQEYGDDFLPGDRYWINFAPLYRAFRTQALELLSSEGIAVVDATDSFQREAHRGPPFMDAVHLSPEGHAMLAGSLGEQIVSMLDE